MKERIIELANELVKEIQEAGYKINSTSEGLGTLYIWVFEKKEIAVENVTNQWEIKGPLTTGIKEEI